MAIQPSQPARNCLKRFRGNALPEFVLLLSFPLCAPGRITSDASPCRVIPNRQSGRRVTHDQVIAPILAGIRSPQRQGHNPASWTPVDRDYENLRIGMKALFQHLGIHATLPAA